MQKIKAFGTWLRTSKNGFFTLAVFGYWLKCYLIYLTKFTLGATGPMQGFLLLINPIPSGMLILGLGMLMKGRKSYVIDFYKRMDQIVVVNPIFIDKLTEYGLDRNKIRYIPNFVAKSEFYEQTQAKKNATRQELGIPQDKFVVFGDGQVQARKGVDDFAKLAEANPDYQFIWAGGFSFGKITDGYDHFKQLVENPPKNLTFTGIIDREKLVDYLNMADLFLLPSFDELFPMSVLEAFSCGTPVLLRDLDLYRAIIDGYYLAGKDSAEMNEQLRFAATHPEVLARQQELSRKASQQYSEDHLAEIWRDFYQEQYQLGRELGQISYE